MWRVRNCGGSINDIRFEDQDDDNIAYAVSLFVSYITTSVCHINAGAHVMKLSSATSSWRPKWLHGYTSGLRQDLKVEINGTRKNGKFLHDPFIYTSVISCPF